MYRVLLICAIASAALGIAIGPKTDASPAQLNSKPLAAPDKDSRTTDVDNNPIYPGPEQRNSLIPPSNYYFASYPVYPPDPHYGANSKGATQLIRLEPIDKTSSESSSLLSSIAPLAAYAVSYGARVSSYLWNYLIVLLVGGALTASICMFTPLCTVFLGLCLNKDEVKEKVTELARTYITPESLEVATVIVKKAIDKYVALQRELEDADENEANIKITKKRRR